MIIPSIANIPPLFNYFTWYNGPAVVDSSILSGWVPPVDLSHIVSYYDTHSSTWHLVAGDYSGSIYSWRWTGSAWVLSPEFLAMLTPYQYVTFTDFGTLATPSMFTINGEDYMIVGNSTGDYFGYHWGSRTWHPGSWYWDVDTSITTGLIDDSSPVSVCGFEIDNVAYLLVASQNGGLKEYNWTGSSWTPNTFIGTGLPSGLGVRGSTNYFEIGPQKFLIEGSYYASVPWTGYVWNGNGWDLSPEIVSGLNAKVGNVSRTTGMFKLTGGNYLIVNEFGLETGFKLG